MNKIIAITFVSLLIFCFLISFASASQTFTVPNLGSQTVSLNLNQGDSVTGTVSVSGGSGNDINFRVTDPNGNTLTSYDRTTSNSFSFSASMTGTYSLIFDNSFSLLSSKSVTLDYSVQSPILGGTGSNNLLLIGGIIVLFVIIFVVAIVVILLSKHSKTNSNNSPVATPTTFASKTSYPIVQENVTKTGTGYCPNCGTALEPNASFCRSCGKKV